MKELIEKDMISMKEFDEILLKLLQRKWNTIMYAEKMDRDVTPFVDEFHNCCTMARDLTGKWYDIGPDDKVFIVGDWNELLSPVKNKMDNDAHEGV